ncbi:hypothetical protein BSR28_01715 [Boudabousia liubingyangii]|uniref:DUF6541 family protein n=1 Tax=Boudabousia liubingyangii TaxID=1921764 RepID=UPI00093DDA4D|nr:DUF6541 family protein [Boudabousia liubingyangii]OKL48445.1 hypothetical protein BSR28_01715 [Boudabousia liubingyangii]
MTGWLYFWLAALLSTAYLGTLGYPLVAFFLRGKRSLLTLLLAPAAAVSFLGVAAVGFHYLHIPWAALTFLVTWGIVWLIFLILKLTVWTPDKETLRSSTSLTVLGVGLLTAATATILFAYRLQFPDSISQTFDAVFHLNQTELFMRRADASSLHVALTAKNQWQGFYPAVWHGIAALIGILTKVNAPVATNILSIFVIAILWPASVGSLAYVIGGKKRGKLIPLAMVASLAFVQFPFHLLDYGVLYPTLIAYALVPALLAVLISIVNLDSITDFIAGVVGFAIMSIGLSLAHPSADFVLFLIGLPLLFRFGRNLMGLVSKNLVLGSLAGAVVMAGSAVAVNYVSLKLPMTAHQRLSPPEWGPVYPTYRKPFWYLATGALGIPEPERAWVYSLVLQLLILAGMIWAVKNKQLWMIFSYLTFGAFTAGAFFITGPLRAYLYGLWYSDLNRIYSAFVIIQVPLLAAGLLYVFEKLQVYLSINNLERGRATQVGLLAASSLALVFFASSGPLSAQLFRVGLSYDFDETRVDSNELLDANEREFLYKVPEYVPEGDAIIGNPWNGSGLVQAFVEREALFPHVHNSNNPDARYLAEHLNEAKSDPKVCQIVNEYKAYYVLEMGDYWLWGGFDPGRRFQHYPGLENLISDGVAEPVYVDPDGFDRILKITACN